MANIDRVNYAPLLEQAKIAMQASYSPYSDFKVGAALVTPSGRIFSGCNVENASYGLTICAECNAISTMAATGERKIAAIVVLSSATEITTPCGACRQTIAEFSEPSCQVYLPYGHDYQHVESFSINDLLPHSFAFDPK